jgi:hypothetical protein
MIREISFMLEHLGKRKDIGEHSAKMKEIKIEADMLLLFSLGENYESRNENTKDLLEIIKWSWPGS